MDDIRNGLNEAIFRELENLKNTAPGTEEYEETIANLDKLYRLRIDEDTVGNEKEKNRMERYFRLGVDIFGIIAPIMFYRHWLKKGFEFEEKGAITSTTFRSLTKWFKPVRK